MLEVEKKWISDGGGMARMKTDKWVAQEENSCDNYKLEIKLVSFLVDDLQYIVFFVSVVVVVVVV